MPESACDGAGSGSAGRNLRRVEAAAAGRGSCRSFDFMALALEYADDVSVDRRCIGK